ncbi:MAG: ASCH domain-containing protein [Frankiaceae bacterium]|nr:ASCH domain-containing protein [Frankiaceae bacterium]MBV9872258.1 ASCH domain-containing protein [Frankiaceae bacterium]
MDFSPELRDAVARGEITVSYRLWQRRQVKPGGRYRSAGLDLTVVVDDMELLPFGTITDDDVARSGEPDLETLRARAAHAGPIDDNTLVWRIEFHVE